ncbi:MAG TPA: DUF1684 domain-containing protein, partial [Chthoniobacterales bacterium]|nr:DUF1684 domain-containing protein [Chthoniobacterales bacterium]
MKKSLAIVALAFIGTIGFSSDTTTSAAWQADLLEWRSQRAAQLQAPEGWLSLIGLEWLKEGDNSVGSAADNRIRIAKAPAHLAVVQLENGNLQLLSPQGGFPKDLIVDDHSPEEQTLYADDAAQPSKPSKLKIGTLTIVLIHRDQRIALRIKDLDAPTRAGFHGLHWYAPDTKYRVRAKWIPYNPPKTLDIPTILGTVDKLPAPGAAEFTLDGKVLRLEPVLEEPDSKELFFILRDETSKTTTYGAGRFLYTDLPDHGVSQPG